MRPPRRRSRRRRHGSRSRRPRRDGYALAPKTFSPYAMRPDLSVGCVLQLMSEVEALQLTLRQLKDRHDEEESRLIAMGEDMERRITALNEALERHR